MSDFAIKVAPPGYDIGTAADYQLTFTSEWPTLKILHTATFSITAGQVTTQVIYTHGLSYTPLVMVIADHSYAAGSAFPSSGQGIMVDPFLYINGTALKYYADGFTPTSAFSGRYFIFAQSVSDTVAATNFLTTAATAVSANNNFKVVVAKAGKDIDSTDPRDFTIHTDYKSPNVHMAGQATIPDDGGGTGTATITHSLGYSPIYLTMLKNTGSYEAGDYWLPFSSSTNGAVVSSNNSQLSIFDVAGNIYYYLIMKDPFSAL